MPSPVSTATASSGTQDEFSKLASLSGEKIDPVEWRGQNLQLKVGQMAVQLFDESKAQPVASWAYAQLSGWEYNPETQILILQVANEGQEVLGCAVRHLPREFRRT